MLYLGKRSVNPEILSKSITLQNKEGAGAWENRTKKEKPRSDSDFPNETTGIRKLEDV